MAKAAKKSNRAGMGKSMQAQRAEQSKRGLPAQKKKKAAKKK